MRKNHASCDQLRVGIVAGKKKVWAVIPKRHVKRELAKITQLEHGVGECGLAKRGSLNWSVDCHRQPGIVIPDSVSLAPNDSSFANDGDRQSRHTNMQHHARYEF